jgi:hypothetical protein
VDVASADRPPIAINLHAPGHRTLPVVVRDPFDLAMAYRNPRTIAARRRIDA